MSKLTSEAVSWPWSLEGGGRGAIFLGLDKRILNFNNKGAKQVCPYNWRLVREEVL